MAKFSKPKKDQLTGDVNTGQKKQQVLNEDIGRKDGFYQTFVLHGANAETTSNYGTIFIARHPVEILRVSVVFEVASTSGTLQIEKLTETTAPSAGTNLLKTAFDLSGTANTVLTKQGYEIELDRKLKENERLALIDGGTITNLENLVITIYFKNFGMGDYR